MLYIRLPYNRVLFINEYALLLILGLYLNYRLMKILKEYNAENSEEGEEGELKKSSSNSSQSQVSQEFKQHTIYQLALGNFNLHNLLFLRAGQDFVDSDAGKGISEFVDSGEIRRLEEDDAICSVPEGAHYINNKQLEKLINNRFRQKAINGVLFLTRAALCRLIRIENLNLLPFPEFQNYFGITSYAEAGIKVFSGGSFIISSLCWNFILFGGALVTPGLMYLATFCGTSAFGLGLVMSKLGVLGIPSIGTSELDPNFDYQNPVPELDDNYNIKHNVIVFNEEQKNKMVMPENQIPVREISYEESITVADVTKSTEIFEDISQIPTKSVDSTLVRNWQVKYNSWNAEDLPKPEIDTQLSMRHIEGYSDGNSPSLNQNLDNTIVIQNPDNPIGIESESGEMFYFPKSSPKLELKAPEPVQVKNQEPVIRRVGKMVDFSKKFPDPKNIPEDQTWNVDENSLPTLQRIERNLEE